MANTAYYTKLLVDEATGKDYPRLLEVWESAVRSTHDFLKAEDFAFYKSRLPLYFDSLDIYACKNEREEILGFLGVKGSKIEMLFIDSEFRGQGIGKKLLEFAVSRLKADKVDVNEQNRQATEFYTHFGFSIAGRSTTDGEGKNYPLLHLELPGHRLHGESRKLFLASFFKDVAQLFPAFAGRDIQGKRVTFIPTASILEKMRFYVGADRRALEKIGLITDELEITKATADEIVAKLKGNDYIFVSGGNTFFLLQELQRTGADKIIAEEIRSGKPYIGSSAGSVVLSPDIEYIKAMDNCAAAPDLKAFAALNIVDFYPLPHHTNFPFKKTVKKIIAEYGTKLELYPISNKQVILVDGDRIEVK